MEVGSEQMFLAQRISVRDFRVLQEYVGVRDILIGFYAREDKAFRNLHANRELILGTAAEFPRIRDMARPGGVLDTKIDNFITNIRSDVGKLRGEIDLPGGIRERLGITESGLLNIRTTINNLPTIIQTRLTDLKIPNIDTVITIINDRIAKVISRSDDLIIITTPLGSFTLPTLERLRTEISRPITLAKNFVECVQVRAERIIAVAGTGFGDLRLRLGATTGSLRGAFSNLRDQMEQIRLAIGQKIAALATKIGTIIDDVIRELRAGIIDIGDDSLPSKVFFTYGIDEQGLKFGPERPSTISDLFEMSLRMAVWTAKIGVIPFIEPGGAFIREMKKAGTAIRVATIERIRERLQAVFAQLSRLKELFMSLNLQDSDITGTAVVFIRDRAEEARTRLGELFSALEKIQLDLTNPTGRGFVRCVLEGITPLAASASSDLKGGTAPVTVQFSTTVGGGSSPYTFAWTFGDGTSSTEQNPKKAYSSVGAFTAQVTVKDSLGNTVRPSAITITVVKREGAPPVVIGGIVGDTMYQSLPAEVIIPRHGPTVQ